VKATKPKVPLKVKPPKTIYVSYCAGMGSFDSVRRSKMVADHDSTECPDDETLIYDLRVAKKRKAKSR